MVLKSRDYVFKMSIFKKLSTVLYSIHWYMYTGRANKKYPFTISCR